MDHSKVQRNAARIKVVKDRAASTAVLKAPTTLATVGWEPPKPSATVEPAVAPAAAALSNVMEAVTETTNHSQGGCTPGIHQAKG
jgi:hypothetical protein